MLSLAELADLARDHQAALHSAVAPLQVGDDLIDTDVDPVVLGAINLSRDSTYRESIAPSTDAAVRKARVMWAQGARVIDIGAESSTKAAARISVPQQQALVEPVLLALAGLGITTSIEAYEPALAEVGLKAGAAVLNYTGAAADSEMFDLAARFGATVIVCFTPGADARDSGSAPLGTDPIPYLLDHFGPRLEHARSLGATELVIDPGLGFYYANTVDPAVRVAYQANVLLNGFRLRTLGVPVGQALPHAIDLFGDEFRIAEAQFALIARLARTGVLRVHEVAKVVATLKLLAIDSWSP